MTEKNKLTMYMGIFYLLVILFFGLIIINEKKEDFVKPIIREKIINYVKNQYKEQTQEFKYSTLKKEQKEKNKYNLKIYNKENKELYFTVTYQKGKITDTYKKDYLEGSSLNKSIENYLNKTLIKEKTNYKKYKITYKTKLNKCTTYIRKRLLKKDYLKPIYTVEVEENINTLEELKETILQIHNYSKKQNINPKNYDITLNNIKNITKSINIVLEPVIIEESIDEVIALIKKGDLTTLKKYNVNFLYLN